MDITAFGDGSFGIDLMADFKYSTNKDGSLNLVAGKRGYPINVMTNLGTFLEVANKAGEIIQDGGDGEWFYVPLGKEPITLRYKKLADPGLSKAQLEKERQTVTRYLLSDRPYDCDLPDTLSGTIKWMEKQLAAIPKAARDKATFRFDTTMEFGETYPNIEITYTELEADEEVIRRIQIERERSRIRESAERAQFRKLKQKFCAS